MKKYLYVVAFLSSVAMMARKAETYPPDTHVINLAEVQQIIWEMQQETEKQASCDGCLSALIREAENRSPALAHHSLFGKT